MGSIKQNLVYKGLLTFANYIIAFITFPYITRVLGPDHFGAVNFTLNTVDYFLLFASMGVSTIGTREIAQCKGNIAIRNKIFSSIFSLNVWFTIITVIIYYSLIKYVAKFNDISNLMIVGGAKILLTVFAVEWLFTGIENFRYITIRNLSVKVIYIIAVFTLVKNPNDTLLYLELTIGSIAVNAIINFIYAQKFIHIILKEFISFRYLIPNLRMGFYTIMTSMYITFNVMFLGLASNNFEVGYYVTAVKLYFIILSLFSAYTSVMLPRMTSVADDKKSAFNSYLSLSYHMAIIIAFPIIIETIVLAPQIITVISGSGYSDSVLPMRILMPALILVWLSQVMAYQGLIPLKKDNMLFYGAMIGGIAAVILNICITPHFRAVGSAIVLVCCEILVTTYYVWIIYKRKYFPLPALDSLKRGIIIAVPYLIIAVGFSRVSNPFLAVGGAVVASLILSVVIMRKEFFRVRQMI